MIVEDIYVKNNSRTMQHVRFESLADMSESLRANERYYRGDHWVREMPNRASWVGRKFYDTKGFLDAAEDTWPEGMSIYNQALEQVRSEVIAPPTSRRRTAVWSEDDGDEIDLERMKRDQPYWRTTRRLQRHGQATVTVLINVSTSASRGAKEIIWRGVAAVMLTELLEQAGYRVELQAICHTSTWTFSGPYSNYGQITQLFLKGPQDYIDTESLVKSISGWFFRTMFFASFNMGGKKVEDSRGMPESIQRITDILTPDPKVMICENLYDMRSAVQWVKDMIQELEPEKDMHHA